MKLKYKEYGHEERYESFEGLYTLVKSNTFGGAWKIIKDMNVTEGGWKVTEERCRVDLSHPPSSWSKSGSGVAGTGIDKRPPRIPGWECSAPLSPVGAAGVTD